MKPIKSIYDKESKQKRFPRTPYAMPKYISGELNEVDEAFVGKFRYMNGATVGARVHTLLWLSSEQVGEESSMDGRLTSAMPDDKVVTE